MTQTINLKWVSIFDLTFRMAVITFTIQMSIAERHASLVFVSTCRAFICVAYLPSKAFVCVSISVANKYWRCFLNPVIFPRKTITNLKYQSRGISLFQSRRIFGKQKYECYENIYSDVIQCFSFNFYSPVEIHFLQNMMCFPRRSGLFWLNSFVSNMFVICLTSSWNAERFSRNKSNKLCAENVFSHENWSSFHCNKRKIAFKWLPTFSNLHPCQLVLSYTKRYLYVLRYLMVVCCKRHCSSFICSS